MAIQTEKELQISILKRLEELGYPSDVIIPDYKQGNIRMDIIVLDDESNLPIMLIECMRTNDRGALARKVEKLRGFTRYFECPLKTYIACCEKDEGFQVYDVTKQIKDVAVSPDECVATEFPNYKTLKKEYKSKTVVGQRKRKKRYINGLRIVSWGIIPFLISGFIVLDAINLYKISVERLILFGLLLVSLLVPFFGQIKLGDITLSHKNNYSNHKHDANE